MTPFRLASASHVRLVQRAAALACLGLVAACGSTTHQAGTRAPASGYVSSADWPRPDSYDPPGPSHDPWGPYIAQASRRFDVPERWIREVMRQESGGRQTATSRVGAMGLMQVMPGTYAELSRRHNLGGDPYHPWDNIMAGTAYVREMYQLYGAPAFLAAYNAGPRRLEDYLWGNRGLPEETRNYVARIGPRIQGTHPNRRAPEEVYAAAEIPLNIPAGPRRGDAATMLALREQRRAVEPTTAIAAAAPATSWGAPSRVASVVAMAPISSPGDPGTTITRMEPVVSPGDPGAPMGHAGSGVTMMARMEPVVSPGDPGAPMGEAVRSESLRAPVAAAPASRSFSLIGTAHAGSLPVPPRGAVQAAVQPASGNWAVQVGAFASENLARAAAGRAKDMVGGPARAATERVAQGREVLFRARVTGLSSRSAAEQACDRLRARGACMVVAPGV